MRRPLTHPVADRLVASAIAKARKRGVGGVMIAASLVDALTAILAVEGGQIKTATELRHLADHLDLVPARAVH